MNRPPRGPLGLLRVVLVKELRETLRDVNALLFSVLFPLLFFPLVMWLFTQVDAYMKGQQETPRVEVIGDVPLGEDLVRVDTDGDAVARREGDVIHVDYRSTDPASSEARSRLQAAANTAWPVLLTEVAPEDEPLAQALGRAVPLMLVIFAMLGGLYPAVEAIVAERERGTVETTQVTAAPRWLFFVGKLGSVFALALLSLLANVLAIGITVAHLLSVLAVDVQFPVGRLLSTLPMGVCVTLFTASVSLLAAAPTRSFKQAQNTTSAAATAIMALAGLGILPGNELDLGWALVPVTNGVLLMGEQISGRPVGALGWLAGAELVLLSGLLLGACARITTRGDLR